MNTVNKQPLYDAAAPEFRRIRERAREAFSKLHIANEADTDVRSWIDENRLSYAC